MENNEKKEIYELFSELIHIAVNELYMNNIEQGLNIISKVIEFYGEIKLTIIDASKVDKTENIFQSIIDATEKKDYILVSDLLEYDLNPQLKVQLVGEKYNI